MSNTLTEKIIDNLKHVPSMDHGRLESFVDETRKLSGNIVNFLMESDIIPPREMLGVLGTALDIPPIDVSRISLDRDLMALVTEKLERRYSVLPISRIGKEITLAVANPTDILAIDDIKTITGCDIELVLSTKKDIQDILSSFYDEADEDISTIIDEGEESSVEIIEHAQGTDIMDLTKESTTAPIVKVVDLIISEAIKRRSSDIHIEPQEKTLRVRYRVDGRLHNIFDLPKINQNAILARLKIMSNLDITETRVPQDGRFRIKLENKEIDFRVSVLPTNFGNKVVLRALDKSNLSIGLDTLGFLPGPMSDFREALSRPFGIILVTGPTGSGKSTTLYSVLTEMNVPEKNIVTIEDPVEYQVGGITQIAARPEIGLDFAGGLRAVLRQSPDVIMVGEIRDMETADIAIKASLTGQMVLSTLHTNDSVGAITRLVNMGIEPFLVASSLIMACAQRLLRKICPHCKTEAGLPEALVAEIKARYPEARDKDEFFKGAGCQRCNGTGYLGRMGVLETLLVDEKIREMINASSSEFDIKKYLVGKGVRDLRGNAMTKFINGLTTYEEVLRVT
ncbi:MAG: GspE/PulE family protein [Candidatus Omnitrophica bacterium]|nr:GspE/PulE family protein [Candidatus Omnitrophota bacterium]MDD5488377.1 GspE/PulE family protein [Candidatus Omnitrophota bacterium]